MKENWARWIERVEFPFVVAILAAFIYALFATAPMNMDFWWAESPSNAMNGMLIHDFIAARAFDHPYAFAVDYFLRYPALTISVYPPVFFVAEAVTYSVFGFSHASAQLTVTFFIILFSVYLYKLMRLAFPPLAAGGAVLIALSLPFVSLWSRQVMLEMPACALLVASAYYLTLYVTKSRPWMLYLAVVFFAASAYTKQTTIFAALPFALLLVWDSKGQIFANRSFWLAGGLAFVLLAPLAVFTIVMASHNLDIVAGLGAEPGSTTLGMFVWYAERLPTMVGILPLSAALLYLGIVAVLGWRTRMEQVLAVLAMLWFATDYLFISAIAHQEDRYGFFLSVPVAMLAMALVSRILPERIFPGAILAIGSALAATTLSSQAVPVKEGYDKAVSIVLQQGTDAGRPILFHGHDSPNVVFAMRQLDRGRSIPILRAEKLLVDYVVSRDLGAKDRDMTPEKIETGIIDRYGIEYVIVQPDFWTDLPSIQALLKVMHSDRFTKIADVPITSNVKIETKNVEIYKNLRPSVPTDKSIRLDMPMMKQTIQGTF